MTALGPIEIRLTDANQRTFGYRLPIGGVVKVGKLKSSSLHIPHVSISRVHAVIESDGMAARVIDLGSTWGTKHNGERIRETSLLSNGDRLGFGEISFEVSINNELRCHDCDSVPVILGQRCDRCDTDIEGAFELAAPSKSAGPATRQLGSYRCPRCTQRLETETLDGRKQSADGPYRSAAAPTIIDNALWIDRCNQCYGVYFDAGEIGRAHREGKLRKTIRRLASSEALPEQPMHYHCPACNHEMRQQHSRTVKDLLFHACGECDGIWVDAAGLRKLADPLVGLSAWLANDFDSL